MQVAVMSWLYNWASRRKECIG